MSSSSIESNWETLGFNDSKWQKVILQAAPPASPWTKILPYYDLASKTPLKIVNCEYPDTANAGNDFKIKLTVDSSVPLAEKEVMLSLNSIYGRCITQEKCSLNSVNCKNTIDNRWILEFSITLPRYFASCRMSAEIQIEGAEFEQPLDLTFNYLEKKLPDTPIKTEVIKTNQGPQLFLNGKKTFMLVGNTMGRAMTSSYFEEIPVNFRTFWARHYDNKNTWWEGDNEYDFTVVDKNVEKLLTLDPNVLIIAIIEIAPPLWWSKKYPGELAAFNDGSIYNYTTAAPSFASDIWLEQSNRAMVKFIEHCEYGPYSSKMGAYLLSNGISAECQYWGSHGASMANKMMDYSEPARKKFRSFIHKRYPEMVEDKIEIPSLKERLEHPIGTFLDPKKNLLSIKYTEFLSDVLSDFMISSCCAAKDTVNGNKIVGIYYGYTFEYPNLDWIGNLVGHSRLQKILDSKSVDFLLSPPSYSIRGLGDCVADMKPFKSIEDAGVLSIIDDDTRTHEMPSGGFYQTVTKEQTRNITRRNFGLALCRMQPLCLLPTTSPTIDFYRDPSIIKDLRLFKQGAQFQLDTNIERKAEIAVVVNEDSAKYYSFEKNRIPSTVKQMYNPDGSVTSFSTKVLRVTGDLLSFQRSRIGQIGAPVDYLLSSDISANVGKYKFWIFLNCTSYDKKLFESIKQIQRTNTVILWVYAPGFIKMEKADINNMYELIGIKLAMLPEAASPVIDFTNFRHPITADLQNTKNGTADSIYPLFFVDDLNAQALGNYRGSDKHAIAVKQTGKSESVFCGSNYLNPDLLRNIAEYAGVHLYSKSLDPVFANESFIVLHARTPGEKYILLKRKCDVVDFFNGQVIQKNVDSFSFDAEINTTYVFYTGEASSFIKYMKYRQN